jgi:hypothetical protein
MNNNDIHYEFSNKESELVFRRSRYLESESESVSQAKVEMGIFVQL